jgi:hypothetical protein
MSWQDFVYAKSSAETGRRRSSRKESSVRGYKGSRLIIANMFLLLTLCSILPSVRSSAVPCEYETSLVCSACDSLPTNCITCKPGYAIVEGEDSGDCIPLYVIHGMTTNTASPNGYGKVTTSPAPLYKPCQESGCIDCFDDYTLSPCGARTTCTGTDKAKIDKTTGAVTCESTAVAGYGAVSNGGVDYLAPCLYPGCTNCDTNYAVCAACAAGYYAHPSDPGHCVANDATRDTAFFASGYGFKITNPTTTPVTGTIAACVDPGCLDCAADYSKCEICKPMAVKLGRRCIYTMGIPATFMGLIGGPDSNTPGAVCNDMNCKLCSDAATCVVCLTTLDSHTADYYATPSGSCVLAAGIPAGFGAEPRLGVVRLCADPDCLTCPNDYRFCESCKITDAVGTNVYLVNGWGICTKTPKENLAGYGISSGNVYAPCSDNTCKYCKQSIGNCEDGVTAFITSSCGTDSDCSECDTANPQSSCATCSTGTNYINNFRGVHRCSALGAGEVALTTNAAKLKMPCKIPGCTTCTNNGDTCSVCQSPYVLSGDGKCIAHQPSPTCAGTCSSTCFLSDCDRFCTDVNCADCDAADPAKCTQCYTDAAAQTYLDAATFTCKAKSAFTASQGVDKTKVKTLGECKYKNGCTNCKDDLNICTACDNANGWYMGDDGATPPVPQCRHATLTPTFPAGKGPNLTSKLVEACTVGATCSKCDADKRICTQCQASPKYYLFTHATDTTLNNCHDKTNRPFPDTYGPKTDGTVVPCTNTNCKVCNVDYTLCVECKPTFYAHTADGSCYQTTDKTTMPAGFGPGTGTPLTTAACVAGNPNCVDCHDDTAKCYECGSSMVADMTTPGCITLTTFNGNNNYGYVTGSTTQVKACADTNCNNDCRTDAAICGSCVATYYHHAVDNKCYNLASIPIGYGIDVPVSGTATDLIACQDVNCKLCKSDSKVCTECKTGYTLKIDAANARTCDSSATPPQGYGVSSTTPPTWSPCDSTKNCKTCEADNTKCQLCNGSDLLEIASSKCYANTAIPAGFGRDLGTTTGQEDIRACSDSTDCNLCEADYTKCTECKNSKYVRLSDGLCYASGSFPSKTGIVPPTAPSTLLKIDTCAVTNCDDCATHYQHCDACNAVAKYRYTATHVCKSTIDTKFGVAPSPATNFETVACSDANCDDCQADNTKCVGCLASYYVDGTACVTTPFANGKGIDKTKTIRTIGACSDTNCKICEADLTICTECKATFYLDDTVCATAPFSTGRGIDKTQAPKLVLGACQDTNCDDCQNDRTICVKCKTGIYLDGTTCAVSPPNGKGEDKTKTTVLTLAACSETNCKVCAADNTKCTECNSPYYVDGTTCVTKPFTGTKGVDKTKAPILVADVCTDANCNDCQDDRTKCVECKATYYLYGTGCVTKPFSGTQGIDTSKSPKLSLV